jgi:hypothetical protein
MSRRLSPVARYSFEGKEIKKFYFFGFWATGMFVFD